MRENIFILISPQHPRRLSTRNFTILLPIEEKKYTRTLFRSIFLHDISTLKWSNSEVSFSFTETQSYFYTRKYLWQTSRKRPHNSRLASVRVA